MCQQPSQAASTLSGLRGSLPVGQKTACAHTSHGRKQTWAVRGRANKKYHDFKFSQKDACSSKCTTANQCTTQSISQPIKPASPTSQPTNQPNRRPSNQTNTKPAIQARLGKTSQSEAWQRQGCITKQLSVTKNKCKAKLKRAIQAKRCKGKVHKKTKLNPTTRSQHFRDRMFQ